MKQQANGKMLTSLMIVKRNDKYPKPIRKGTVISTITSSGKGFTGIKTDISLMRK